MAETQHAHRPAEDRAIAIAQAAQGAWYRSIGPRRQEALVGTVAALALHAALSTAETPDPDALAKLGADDFNSWINQAWGAAWFARPDLVAFAAPVIAWAENADRPTRAASLAAARAAIEAGIFPFMRRYRYEVDLLGFLVQDVHTESAKKSGGVFHTPGNIASLIEDVLGAEVGYERREFADEFCGTGELARAAAESMRAHGIDPARTRWYLNDVDATAAACAAVNAWIWGLGPLVLIGTNDILADPVWVPAAAATRRAAIEHRDELVSFGALARALLRAAQNLEAGAPAPDEKPKHPVSGYDPSDGPERCGGCAYVYLRPSTRGPRTKCALALSRRHGRDVPADLAACTGFAPRPAGSPDPYAQVPAPRRMSEPASV
jgi:hypothetical protein